jgi:hypothetical protein
MCRTCCLLLVVATIATLERRRRLRLCEEETSKQKTRDGHAFISSLVGLWKFS